MTHAHGLIRRRALLLLCTVLAGCRGPAGGWLLMHPPVFQQDSRYFVNAYRPVSRWHHAEAFDTAAACEQTLQFWISEQDRAARTYEQNGKTEAEARAWARAFTLGRCVPSEAVYPPRTTRATSW